MTTTLDRPPLENALGIPGARSVSLLDPDGPAVLWWAGDAAPGTDEAVSVVSLARAAAGLVSLSELGDVILTSTDEFHLVRIVGDGTARVAHLTLRRSDANLAMARHEFRVLLEAAAVSTPPPPTAFTLLNQPYSADEDVLDRILATLRRL